MKGYAPIFFGFFLFSAVVVFYVFLNQTKQIDLSTAAEKRTNCVTFAQNSAKSALDKYIDQYYKNEGAAIIPSEDIVNVENYIKESMAAYDASIADVNSITVGNCTVTTGSYSQQPHSSASGENRHGPCPRLFFPKPSGKPFSLSLGSMRSIAGSAQRRSKMS